MNVIFIFYVLKGFFFKETWFLFLMLIQLLESNRFLSKSMYAF